MGWREEGQISSGPKLEPAPPSPHVRLRFLAAEQVLPMVHRNASPQRFTGSAQEMKAKGCLAGGRRAGQRAGFMSWKKRSWFGEVKGTPSKSLSL